MSSNYNALFRNDPVRFINTYSADIKTWFEGLMLQGGGGLGGALLAAANATGFCRLDFEPVGGLLGFRINTVQVRMIPHGGIDAYWAPYHAGGGLPGFTDVLRVNPPCRFVFTPGMNGCAFVVTDSPKGATYMRVYHNQHPNDNNIWQHIHGRGQNVISYAGFEDYGGGALPIGINPVAFNFLYYRNGTWIYVFQPQSFNALSRAPAQRMVDQSSTRSVF
jgi:hypothetical protein